MGEIEFGTCDICGKETELERTYFYDLIRANISNILPSDIQGMFIVNDKIVKEQP